MTSHMVGIVLPTCVARAVQTCASYMGREDRFRIVPPPWFALINTTLHWFALICIDADWFVFTYTNLHGCALIYIYMLYGFALNCNAATMLLCFIRLFRLLLIVLASMHAILLISVLPILCVPLLPILLMFLLHISQLLLMHCRAGHGGAWIIKMSRQQIITSDCRFFCLFVASAASYCRWECICFCKPFTKNIPYGSHELCETRTCLMAPVTHEQKMCYALKSTYNRTVTKLLSDLCVTLNMQLLRRVSRIDMDWNPNTIDFITEKTIGDGIQQSGKKLCTNVSLADFSLLSV